jgi:hypothetical protein
VYPDDDLQAALVEGKWQFAHKDGRRIEAGPFCISLTNAMTEVIAIITSTPQLPVCRARKYSMAWYCRTHWVFARTKRRFINPFVVK